MVGRLEAGCLLKQIHSTFEGRNLGGRLNMFDSTFDYAGSFLWHHQIFGDASCSREEERHHRVREYVLLSQIGQKLSFSKRIPFRGK